jgi:hypothetical protein
MQPRELLLFIVPLVIVVVIFIVNFAIKGFKGSFFGGKILKSSKKIELSKAGVAGGHIVVHIVEHKPEPKIGIEIVHKTFASYNMQALVFDKKDVIELISELTIAASELDNPPHTQTIR